MSARLRSRKRPVLAADTPCGDFAGWYRSVNFRDGGGAFPLFFSPSWGYMYAVALCGERADRRCLDAS
jgi:hypothetical protein